MNTYQAMRAAKSSKFSSAHNNKEAISEVKAEIRALMKKYNTNEGDLDESEMSADDQVVYSNLYKQRAELEG